MKTIYWIECEEIEFFFDKKGNNLSIWWSNDARYRSEYMDPLFKNLGYKVEQLKPTDPLVSEYIKNYLKKMGYSDADIEERMER
ncbi:MAG: hypothetical protein DWQ19_12285 [Crenarchaeota archaeon]|nr:MAG: hypothetical protein DWQ19_12285 [Thermoproteota archaeon]